MNTNQKPEHRLELWGRGMIPIDRFSGSRICIRRFIKEEELVNSEESCSHKISRYLKLKNKYAFYFLDS